MFPIESFQKTVLKITSVLERLEVPFHLTGGVTGVAYGEPRLTQDIDIVIGNEATAKQLPSLIRLLDESDFMFDKSAIEKAVQSEGMFQLFDVAESLKLDMYPRELILGELSRSVTSEIFSGVFLPIVSKVDAAASKLIWISKGSHKSRRDLRQLVRNFSEQENALLIGLVDKLELAQLLKVVLQESDEIVD